MTICPEGQEGLFIFLEDEEALTPSKAKGGGVLSFLLQEEAEGRDYDR